MCTRMIGRTGRGSPSCRVKSLDQADLHAALHDVREDLLDAVDALRRARSVANGNEPPLVFLAVLPLKATVCMKLRAPRSATSSDSRGRRVSRSRSAHRAPCGAWTSIPRAGGLHLADLLDDVVDFGLGERAGGGPFRVARVGGIDRELEADGVVGITPHVLQGREARVLGRPVRLEMTRLRAAGQRRRCRGRSAAPDQSRRLVVLELSRL